MRRAIRSRKPLDLKPLYTPGELARSLGIGRRRLLRLLQMHDVVLFETGARVLVPVSEIRDKVGPLWESLRAQDRQDGREVD